MKEKLEEAAKNHSNQTIRDDSEKSFIEGAKWMEQSSYSYDEVRAIAYKAYCLGQLEEPTENKYNGWIQQFKK
jgi:hypothetical protein